MRLDLVIPTYRRVRKLERLLLSIQTGTYTNYRVVIYADNQCRDTVAAFDGDYRVDELIVNDRRRRPFWCWNDWLGRSDAEAVVCLTDDVELYPDCLKGLALAFDERDLDSLVLIHQAHLPRRHQRLALGAIGFAFADRFPNRQCFCPDYSALYADRELVAYAETTQDLIRCPAARALPARAPRRIDPLEEDPRLLCFDRDRAHWRRRRKAGLLWGRQFERLPLDAPASPWVG